jgi:4,4'-diaponeurosporenoate glycosyltransferase
MSNSYNSVMSALALLFWLFGFGFLWNIPLLSQRRIDGPSSLGVSVIIPARNEEANLGRLLSSLAGQTVMPAEIIVVDDHSVDGTARVAHDSGATVLTSVDLPDGWVGKTWACWQGAHRARGDILIFLDADTVLEPEAISRILAEYTNGAGLLSIQPYHLMEVACERLGALFNLITMAGTNAFTVFGARLRPLGAFGPCMVCSREDYFSVGGHERAKGDVLESLAMGTAFVDAGHEVRCYGGKGTLAFRMYPDGIRSMVEGFAKSFAIGANTIAPLTLLVIVCWVFGCVAVTRHLVEAVFEGTAAGLSLWAALDLLYAAQIYWMLARIGNFGVWPALFFQVPLLFFLLVFAMSLVQTFLFRKVRWKGRLVDTRGSGGHS